MGEISGEDQKEDPRNMIQKEAYKNVTQVSNINNNNHYCFYLP